MEEWSLDNSTGTVDMGIWGDTPSEAGAASNPGKTGLSIPTHRYPLFVDNVGDNNTEIVQECIHFTAIKQGGISLQKDADNKRTNKAIEDQVNNAALKKRIGRRKSFAKNASADEMFDWDHASEAERDTMLSKRKDLDNEQTVLSAAGGGIKSLGTMFKGQLKAMQTEAKNLEHCFIYMPNSIQFAEGAQWGAEALGGVGNAIKQGLRGEGNIDSMMKNFSGGIITEVAKGAALAGGAAAAGVVGALGVAAAFGGVGSGLRAAGRFTQNPYEEQLFNGVGFREFTFEFAFAPASEAEGMEVDKIIKMFRKHSRPSFVGGFLGEGLYTFPNEFGIDFQMNKGGALVPNTYLPKIHNCVCTNVTTNYSPEGFWVALRDGRPVSYNLGLSFTETVKITQSNKTDGHGGVEEGY